MEEALLTDQFQEMRISGKALTTGLHSTATESSGDAKPSALTATSFFLKTMKKTLQRTAETLMIANLNKFTYATNALKTIKKDGIFLVNTTH